MSINEQTFKDLKAYRDDLPIPKQVSKALNFALQYLRPGDYVLDYGCGTGRYSVDLVDRFNVCGIEPVLEAMFVAQGRGIRFTGLPNLFEFVMCIEVFEHLEEPDVVIDNIYSWLRTGGMLFITVPNAAWWKHRANLLRGKVSYVEGDGYTTWNNPHIRMWTFKSLYDFLTKNGFTIFPEYIYGTYAGFKGGSFLMELTGNYSLLSAGIMMLAKKR